MQHFDVRLQPEVLACPLFGRQREEAHTRRNQSPVDRAITDPSRTRGVCVCCRVMLPRTPEMRIYGHVGATNSRWRRDSVHIGHQSLDPVHRLRGFFSVSLCFGPCGRSVSFVSNSRLHFLPRLVAQRQSLRSPHGRPWFDARSVHLPTPDVPMANSC